MGGNEHRGRLILEDGSSFDGFSFGYKAAVAGEVVFNTGMVGYPESLTDPSYRGQILSLSYPLIGNYGVPGESKKDGLKQNFESDKIQVTGLIISDYSKAHSHWNSSISLSEWLTQHKIPALCGIDTRALTKKLRQRGVMLGKIIFNKNIELYDPNRENLVASVSIKEPIIYGMGKTRLLLLDCGAKNNIIRSLVARDASVMVVPWDHDISKERFDGLLISNGPGDPKMCRPTIENIRKVMQKNIPIMGICMGNQLLALAAGADTYKLKYGHRSQNQPCIDTKTGRAYITSQNHGFAVDKKSLPRGWKESFVNANDGTNEGIRHSSKPFFSVQFHPEACPGPMDTAFLFDRFIDMIR